MASGISTRKVSSIASDQQTQCDSGGLHYPYSYPETIKYIGVELHNKFSWQKHSTARKADVTGAFF